MATDPTIAAWLIDHAWAPLSAGIAGVWAHTNGRFRALEKKKLDEALFKQWAESQERTFSEHVARTERAQLQAREAVIKMYDKLDDLKDIMLRKPD